MAKATIDQSPEALTAAVIQALGSHPEDIACMMNTSCDVMAWLSDLFKAIEAAAKAGDKLAILRHADHGRYLADDFSNSNDVQREQMVDAMNKVGIKNGGCRG